MSGKNKKSWVIYALGGIAVMSPWVIYVIFFHNQTISSSTSDWGSFGDYIGGVSSVITAFVSFIYQDILIEKILIMTKYVLR